MKEYVSQLVFEAKFILPGHVVALDDFEVSTEPSADEGECILVPFQDITTIQPQTGFPEITTPPTMTWRPTTTAAPTTIVTGSVS